MAEMRPGGTARHAAARARRRPEEAKPDVRGVATVSPGTDISKLFAQGGAELPVGSGGCGGGCPRS